MTDKNQESGKPLVFPSNLASEAANGVKGPSSANITLSILTSHNNVAKKIIYRDAVPTLLGDIAFEAAAGDVQYMTSVSYTHLTLPTTPYV